MNSMSLKGECFLESIAFTFKLLSIIFTLFENYYSLTTVG